MRAFLKNKNSSSPVTYGFDFKTYVPYGYHSGGAGYILSNNALNKIGSYLHKNYKNCSNTGIEDYDIGYCARNIGIYPNKSIDRFGRERFHPFNVGTHILGYYPDWIKSYSSNPLKSVSELFLYLNITVAAICRNIFYFFAGCRVLQ